MVTIANGVAAQFQARNMPMAFIFFLAIAVPAGGRRQEAALWTKTDQSVQRWDNLCPRLPKIENSTFRIELKALRGAFPAKFRRRR
jgi:hypothetical protein